MVGSGVSEVDYEKKLASTIMDTKVLSSIDIGTGQPRIVQMTTVATQTMGGTELTTEVAATNN